MPDVWGLAAIAAKLALYLGILAGAGTVFAAAVFKLSRYRRLAASFAVIGIIATLFSFSLRGAMLTGDAAGMIDVEMLGLLWGTPVGTAFVYRLVGLGLLMLGLLVGRGGVWLSCFGGVLAIWSFDHVGHVPDRDTMLLDVALTFHLLAIALWIGILTPLKRLARHHDTWDLAAAVGHKFGQIAAVTVPLLIGAGGYMAYDLVGSVTALFATAYGQTLVVKVALLVGVLGLAAANKLRFIPGIKAAQEQAAVRLCQSISLEWAIIIVILATTAVLTSTLSLPT